MDEDNIQQSLDVYRAQLNQVEQQVAAVGETEELKSLVADLKELIALTEGSLLSLKKSKLFKTLEDAESLSSSSSVSSAPQPSSSSASVSVSAAPSTMDDEYALFQAALQEDLADGGGGDSPTTASQQQPSTLLGGGNSFLATQPSSSPRHSPLPCATHSIPHDSGSADSGSSDSEGGNGGVVLSKGENCVDEELSSLVGMKCCAPFSHDWGKLDYHNALVMSAVRDSLADEILVKVMFTTPTHIAMQPCRFFLDGHCRFNDDKCKFSHGETVELRKLREFVEADHSMIVVDTKCMAQYRDGIWYPATVTEVTEDVISVHFDDYGEDLDVDMTQVVPSVPQTDHSASDSDADDNETDPQPSTSTGQGSGSMLDSEDEIEEELPVFLWKPPQTTGALGEWEMHTRGIGSKLMSRMGYIPGQGLGVSGQGKAEPIPIMLLPQGKSLDRIMELKELAGDQDLFNAMEKLERRKRKMEKRQAEESRKAASAADDDPPANVFDFINKKLAGKKGVLN
ncbi:hypothetical protein ACOMHN_021958 [Nucella lapillus]